MLLLFWNCSLGRGLDLQPMPRLCCYCSCRATMAWSPWACATAVSLPMTLPKSLRQVQRPRPEFYRRPAHTRTSNPPSLMPQVYPCPRTQAPRWFHAYLVPGPSSTPLSASTPDQVPRGIPMGKEKKREFQQQAWSSRICKLEDRSLAINQSEDIKIRIKK